MKNEIPGRSASENEKEAVLLRAYGSGSEILVDRDMEARTHALLTQHKLAAPLLARFENGLLYRFAPGRACKPEDIGREFVWRAVAARLGEWHALLPLPEKHGDQQRNIWTVLQQWVDALPTDTSNARTTKERLGKELCKSLSDLGQAQARGDDQVSLQLVYSLQRLLDSFLTERGMANSSCFSLYLVTVIC